VIAHFSTIAQVPVLSQPGPFRFERYPSDALSSHDTEASVNNTQSTQIEDSKMAVPIYNPSMWVIEQHYVKPGMTPQEQKRYADQQIAAHEFQKEQNRKEILEANNALDELRIDYEFPFEDLPEKRNYAFAFGELNRMIRGETPANIETAVFLVERAFDPTLNYAAFDEQLNKSALVIGLKMQQDKIAPNDNLGKIMTTFKFFADTISVATKGETRITTYPKAYDFEDFWGRQDYRKMFVSKLLKEGSGQCHSLPLLFLIICEKIHAEAHLAFAPNHSFVKFQDKKMKWHNIELTSNMLASDHFLIESGYIKAEAMRNRIYLEPLSKREVVIQCLNDLAMSYEKKYGYDEFVRECASTALSYNSNSLTARQILANYYNALGAYVIYQYKKKGLTREQFEADPIAKRIVSNAQNESTEIDNLGYADMPPEAYAHWLNSIQKEAMRQRHSNEVKVLGAMIELKK
jgi:hypothetical protein